MKIAMMLRGLVRSASMIGAFASALCCSSSWNSGVSSTLLRM